MITSTTVIAEMKTDLFFLKTVQKKSIQIILSNCKWNLNGCKFKGSEVEHCSYKTIKSCPILAPIRDVE